MSKTTIIAGFQPGRSYTIEFEATEQVTVASVIAELEKLSGKSADGFETTVGTDVASNTSPVEDGDIVGLRKKVIGGAK